MSDINVTVPPQQFVSSAELLYALEVAEGMVRTAKLMATMTGTTKDDMLVAKAQSLLSLARQYAEQPWFAPALNALLALFMKDGVKQTMERLAKAQ